MLCHDMDFAIPWIPLHIHGFHWMEIFFSAVVNASSEREREREREMPCLIGHKTEKDSFCSKLTIGFSDLHTNWIKIIKAGRDITSMRTLTVDITVANIHVISRENDSNLNGIQCKRRLIMYLCCAR